jgi:hypothetical protein
MGSTSNSFDLGEIFHGQTDLPTNFWVFIHAKASNNSNYKHSAYWKDAWSDYIKEQSLKFSAKLLIFDLKIEYFPFIRRQNGLQMNFFEGPETQYVYLRRKNTAAQIISHYLARA